MDTNWLAEIPAYAMEHPYLAAALGLLPSVNKGVSKAADLLMAPLVREKARRDMLSRAQTEQDIQAIKEGRAHFDGKGLVPAMPELTPLHDYQPFWQGLPPQQFPMAAALQEEGENLHTTLALAMEELARTPDDKVSDKAVDKDWFSRWRAEARLVTSDELRRMWARILVEEVKEPEAVSLKTLDVLKNLTKSDIDLFIKIARYHIGGLIFVTLDEENTNPFFMASEYEAILLQNRDLLSEVRFTIKFKKYYGDYGNIKSEVNCHGIKFIVDYENPVLFDTKFFSFALSLAAKELISIANIIPHLLENEVIHIGDFIFSALHDKSSIHAIRVNDNKLIHTWKIEENI